MEAIRKRLTRNTGFTLIELVLVVVLIGLMATLTTSNLGPVIDRARLEETKQEMDRLAFGIVGDARLRNDGTRIDYGFVGDVGSLPANLDALVSNPGAYATWKGPYIKNEFVQDSYDYARDAWGSDYLYSGGIELVSNGSGQTITRPLASSLEALLYNSLSGVISDRDGTSPGAAMKDSLIVRIVYPNGVGGRAVRAKSPDAAGFFSFDSLPIGNHQLEIIYFPAGDTSRLLASINPGDEIYYHCQLPSDYWGDGREMEKVPGSDSLSANCHGFSIWIANNSSGVVTVDSLRVSWPSPIAYYRYAIWNGFTLFDRPNPKASSNEWITLSTAQFINPGDAFRLEIDGFKDARTGGANVDMNNTVVKLKFSDGSVIEVTTESCP